VNKFLDSSVAIKIAVEILAKNEHYALPIVENEILVGIVTTSNILNYLFKQYDLETN